MKIKVIIKLKQGVLDPQAKAIFHALGENGFNNVKDVLLAKEIIIDIDEVNGDRALESVGQMCEVLLANTVIEEYSLERIA